MSRFCTWLPVGWLSTNCRLSHRQTRKDLARSHIHPIQACVAAPSHVLIHLFFSADEGGFRGGFHCHPFTDFPARCSMELPLLGRSADTRSPSLHTGFNQKTNLSLNKSATGIKLISYGKILQMGCFRLSTQVGRSIVKIF